MLSQQYITVTLKLL